MCNAIWIGSSLFDNYRSHSGSADACVLFQEPEYADLSGFDGNLIKTPITLAGSVMTDVINNKEVTVPVTLQLEPYGYNIIMN